ncbi:MAG: hypothetical protein JXQ96_23150 [Cyclobacteriaceae bacterium]
MKKVILILVLTLFVQELDAQVGVINNQVQANSYPGAQVYEIPMKTPGLIGSTFLSDSWLVGDVWMTKDGVLEKMPLKYNILEEELLFQASKRIMMVKLHRVDSFSMLQPLYSSYTTFIVNKDWTIGDVPAVGVFQRLTRLKGYVLLKKYEIIYKDANYNKALAVGEKDNKYVQKSSYYILNTKSGELEHLPARKNKFEDYFQSKEISSFIKENRINFKEEQDLIKLVKYSNSLEN